MAESCWCLTRLPEPTLQDENIGGCNCCRATPRVAVGPLAHARFTLHPARTESQALSTWPGPHMPKHSSQCRQACGRPKSTRRAHDITRNVSPSLHGRCYALLVFPDTMVVPVLFLPPRPPKTDRLHMNAPDAHATPSQQQRASARQPTACRGSAHGVRAACRGTVWGVACWAGGGTALPASRGRRGIHYMYAPGAVWAACGGAHLLQGTPATATACPSDC